MDTNNQWQQQPPNMQQPYNMGMQQQYNMQQPYNMGMQNNYAYQMQNNKKGLSITALIIGILSITLCCCFGWIPGLIGTVVAIIALAKEPRGRVMATIGLILSVVSIVMSMVCMLIDTSSFTDAFKEGFESGYSAGADLFDDEDEHFWGSKYTGSDDSVIYFYSDDSFEWFLTDYDYDNLKTGEYDVIFGEAAVEWLTEDHTEYGVTMDELEEYWDMNSDSDLYKKENLTILTLTTEIATMDGEQQNDEPYTVFYYGYSNEEGFDGVNLNTFNYMTLYTEY